MDGEGVVRLGAGTQGKAQLEVPIFQIETFRIDPYSRKRDGKNIENKNKVVNYIWHACPIFRFATQTFNGGYKRKMNTQMQDERYICEI